MGLDVAGTNFSANEGDREGVYRIVLYVTVTKMPERNEGGKAECVREISVLQGRVHGGGNKWQLLTWLWTRKQREWGPGGGSYKGMPLVTDSASQLLPHEGSMLSRRAPQTRGGDFKSQACFISSRIQTITRRGPFCMDQVSAFFETSKME